MNLRFKLALAAWFVLTPFALPATVLADAGQPTVAAATEAPAQPPMACPRPGDGKLNTAQIVGDCCKDHKGVCGCRAGKIVCCDGTASTQPGCTCHGDNGFLQ